MQRLRGARRHSLPVCQAVKIDIPMQRVAVIRIVAIGQTFADIPTVLPLAISSGVTVMPIAVSFPAGAIDGAAACAALVVGLAVLLNRRAAVGGKTLVGGWGGTALALGAWAGGGVGGAVGVFEPSGIAPLRLAGITPRLFPGVG